MSGRLGVGFHENVPHAAYHADPAERPSLSRSIAAVLLTRSEAHAKLAHPRLSKLAVDFEDESEPLQRGNVLHHFCLGGGQQFEVVMKTDRKTGVVEAAGDYRTDSAKAHRDTILSAGKTPILQEKLAEYEAVSVRIRERIEIPERTEVTAIWEANGVLCRCRFDGLLVDGPWDLKTCSNAVAASSPSQIIECGLDIQDAAYTEAWETLTGEPSRPMAFQFVEVDGACETLLVHLDAELRELGRRKWRRAQERWQRALETGIWPGYPAEARIVECPPWALAQEMDMQINAIPKGGSSGLTF